jgi:hypothetical protein
VVGRHKRRLLAEREGDEELREEEGSTHGTS